MSSWYFPLGNIWLTFTKIAFLIYISPQYVFFCYVSETEYHEWYHRQPPSKNQPVSQRQSGFSLSYPSFRHLIFHNLKSHSKWGSSVQRSSCLRSASVTRPPASCHLTSHSGPLCGIVALGPALPLHLWTHLTFVSLKDNDFCEDSFWLGSQISYRVLAFLLCTFRSSVWIPTTQLKKKKPWVWWRMPVIPELGSGGRGFTGHPVSWETLSQKERRGPIKEDAHCWPLPSICTRMDECTFIHGCTHTIYEWERCGKKHKGPWAP